MIASHIETPIKGLIYHKVLVVPIQPTRRNRTLSDSNTQALEEASKQKAKHVNDCCHS